MALMKRLKNSKDCGLVRRVEQSVVASFQIRAATTVKEPGMTGARIHYSVCLPARDFLKITATSGRGRDRAELMTDDRGALRERLEAATGERIAALEAIESKRTASLNAGRDAGRGINRESSAPVSQGRERKPTQEIEKAPEPKSIDLEL